MRCLPQILVAAVFCAVIALSGCICHPHPHHHHQAESPRVWILPSQKAGPGVLMPGPIATPIPEQPQAFSPLPR